MTTRFSSKATLMKGGEMMRILVLAVSLMLVLSASAYAVEASYDVYEGWNLISVPTVPMNADPYSVFSNLPGGIDAFLSGWDPTLGAKGPVDFGDASGLGNILLGDGYWLYVDAGMAGKVKYDGLENGVPATTGGAKTDMWISLPGNGNDAFTSPDPGGNPNRNGGGWHMVGCPFNSVTPVDSGAGTGDRILFTDGIEVKNWGDAVAASWVAPTLNGQSPVYGGSYDVGFDGLSFTDKMEPGKGYWLNTYKDNLAMIILAP